MVRSRDIVASLLTILVTLLYLYSIKKLPYPVTVLYQRSRDIVDSLLTILVTWFLSSEATIWSEVKLVQCYYMKWSEATAILVTGAHRYAKYMHILGFFGFPLESPTCCRCFKVESKLWLIDWLIDWLSDNTSLQIVCLIWRWDFRIYFVAYAPPPQAHCDLHPPNPRPTPTPTPTHQWYSSLSFLWK